MSEIIFNELKLLFYLHFDTYAVSIKIFTAILNFSWNSFFICFAKLRGFCAFTEHKYPSQYLLMWQPWIRGKQQQQVYDMRKETKFTSVAFYECLTNDETSFSRFSSQGEITNLNESISILDDKISSSGAVTQTFKLLNTFRLQLLPTVNF